MHSDLSPQQVSHPYPPGGLSRYHPGRFADSLPRERYTSIAPADWGAPFGAIDRHTLASFAESWDRLVDDRWMGDGGRYRRRRFAAFAVADGAITRKQHRPHFQKRAHNRLNGGISRWFSPVERMIGEHVVTSTLLRIGEELANALIGWAGCAWHAELHRFRIDASHQIGKPSPEGLHQDGVTAVLMILIDRRNVRGGVTMLVEDGRLVAQFELASPLQAIVLDDIRLRHTVTPVIACNMGVPARRDALVITFRPERNTKSFPLKETSNG